MGCKVKRRFSFDLQTVILVISADPQSLHPDSRKIISINPGSKVRRETKQLSKEYRGYEMLGGLKKQIWIRSWCYSLFYNNGGNGRGDHLEVCSALENVRSAFQKHILKRLRYIGLLEVDWAIASGKANNINLSIL